MYGKALFTRTTMSVGKDLKCEPDAILTSSCFGFESFRQMPGIKKKLK